MSLGNSCLSAPVMCMMCGEYFCDCGYDCGGFCGDGISGSGGGRGKKKNH